MTTELYIADVVVILPVGIVSLEVHSGDRNNYVASAEVC